VANGRIFPGDYFLIFVGFYGILYGQNLIEKKFSKILLKAPKKLTKSVTES